MDVQIRIASVSHSCASDFKMYMSNLASSIRNAATEMALGIVHRRTESMMHDTILPSLKPNNKLTKTYSFSDHYGLYPPAPTPKCTSSYPKLPSYKLNLDVLVETPVIVLPSHERSFEVLVAHLGEISITNKESEASMEKYVISIKDMNFKVSDLLDLLVHFKGMTTKELYGYHSEFSIPILHDTGVDLTLNKGILSQSYTSFASIIEDQTILRNVYHIDCVMSDTLKITINRSQYEQILLSLKSPPKDEDPPLSSRAPRRDSSTEEMMPESFSSIVETSRLKDVDLVNVNFQDFAVHYKKYDASKYNLDIILKSLTMEDLVLPNGSRHKQLMTSIGEPIQGSWNKSFKNGLSNSCPNLRRLRPNKSLSSSLPSSLNVETIFGIPLANVGGDLDDDADGGLLSRSSLSESTMTHPSKSDLCENKNLVHIKIEDYNIDDGSHECDGKNHVKRLVDIDFNNLDIVINLKTWVSVLDFFSLSDSSSCIRFFMGLQVTIRLSNKELPQGCIKIDLRVKSLSVLLNKPEYELSKISVCNFAAKMKSSDEDFSIKGHLGNFSLKDLTPTGRLYSDRFISRKGSNQVLHFDFFQYSSMDERLERDFDASLSLHMDQVIYVHTQRFYTELTAYFAEFNRLQKLVAASSVPEDGVFQRSVSREMRLKLAIEADSTIIFLPMSSYSTRILTIDLGQLSVHNRFAFSGDPSTISPETISTTLVGQMSRAQSCESLSSRRSRSRMGSRRRAFNSGNDEDSSNNTHDSILVNELHNCLLD
ncbi:Uncharacterized protein FKW44_023999, partial [Caligus rogercresseyi]